jgi:hypothetical protein
MDIKLLAECLAHEHSLYLSGHDDGDDDGILMLMMRVIFGYQKG